MWTSGGFKECKLCGQSGCELKVHEETEMGERMKMISKNSPQSYDAWTGFLEPLLQQYTNAEVTQQTPYTPAAT